MPPGRRYRRRNSRRRGRRSSKLRYIKRRTGAKSQSRQIASLERRVSQLNKEATQYAQFEARPEGSAGTGIDLTNGDFHVSCIIRPNQWQPLFQTGTLTGANTTFTVNKMKVTSADLQFVFSPSDSLEPLTPRIVRLWILKLRKETAMDVLSETANMSTAGLNASASANNDLVHQSTTGGGLMTMVKFNPAAFDIKAYREFTVANILEETAVGEGDTVLQNTKDALKRVRIRMPMGNEFKVAKGGVLELAELDTMPLDRWYAVAHVGGWDGGLSAVNTVRMDTNWVLNSKMYI